MKMNVRRFILATVAVCFGSFLSTYAQETTGSIIGTIKDANGAAVPNVTVTINSPSTGFSRSYQTTSEGVFTATLLPPGVYALTVEVAGFKKYVQSNIQISVNDRRPVDIVLET